MSRWLAALSEALAARQSRTALSGLARSLIEHLRVHFEHEENDGFFASITRHAPWLADRSTAVENQHPKLMAELETFAAQTGGAGDGDQDWWHKRDQEFRAFVGNFEKHEEEEHRLLQEAYDRDQGARD